MSNDSLRIIARRNVTRNNPTFAESDSTRVESKHPTTPFITTPIIEYAHTRRKPDDSIEEHDDRVADKPGYYRFKEQTPYSAGHIASMAEPATWDNPA